MTVTITHPSGKKARDTIIQPDFYLRLYRATPQERVQTIKAGIRAQAAKDIIGRLDIPQGRVFEALKVSQSTVNRKAKQGELLSASETERVLGVAKLAGQVQAMVEESGDPAGFDALAWLSTWLEAPLPALGGARPVDWMDSMEGQALISTMLSRMQSGAYT